MEWIGLQSWEFWVWDPEKTKVGLLARTGRNLAGSKGEALEGDLSPLSGSNADIDKAMMPGFKSTPPAWGETTSPNYSTSRYRGWGEENGASQAWEPQGHSPVAPVTSPHTITLVCFLLIFVLLLLLFSMVYFLNCTVLGRTLLHFLPFLLGI